MIMCVLLCYPVSIHMSQLQATGRPISSFYHNILPSRIDCRRYKRRNLPWGQPLQLRGHCSVEEF